ncbi:nuclear pore complex protein NUP214 [Henckelia pumila]|uniref:nuclear pore complex protein NUP214 n=1 Tax=Henckelia pumila TaxID=405737 RepID=UPI003C6DBC9D
MASDGAPVIQLDEEIEGEEVGSRNYRFSKLGEPVPICSTTFKFDPGSLPTQPLSVSEKFRLLFVAHPAGFYVARTRDVIASAEQIKDKQTAKSVQELCLVDVPVQNVTILALSPDDSLLAATEGSNAHFFAVSALLHKEQKPSFSVQLDDSVCIKDLRWARNVAKVYVILSAHGQLFYGSGHGPLSHVMENVDSVDWSVKGNFVAVARKNNISILSSQMKEKLSFSLPFRSVIGDNDSDVNQVIKVDSVRWIRPDCIAVGCFELNDDGEEQNYIVQVITSKEGRLTDAGSKASVLSFNNVFLDFCSDAVLAQNGPHLFLSYLDLYGLAFIANRNLSRQIGLLCWSLDSGKNEAAVIEILNDAWILYIDSQGDGEENVILGISVDKVSQDKNAKLILGDEDTEVSPSCVIICLTIDGKISVFHFASAADALSSPNGGISEDDNTSEVSLKHELAQISFGGVEGSGEQISSKSDFHILGNNEKVKADAETSVNENVELKSAVNTHTLKLAEPTRLQSEISNKDSSAEIQSMQDAKAGMSFSSAKAVRDFSNQSLTWSSGRIDAPKTSVGRFFSVPFNEVDDSDKCTSQSAGAVLRESSDISKKAEPSAKFTAFGLKESNRFGNAHSLPAYTVSQAPLVEAVVPGKFPNSEIYKDTFPSSIVTGLPNSMQNASKQQFGNVEGMAKKLDILLQGIEEKGGFTDASMNSKKKLVRELEDTMWALSSRCRMWRGLLDDKSKEVQLLLDKTAQVLVRKVYLEGIFKQDADSRYWELWNRQNLSSELELKRRHVLDLNQELTNQLIELEKYFNSLEFNKFGGNGALLRKSRTSESEYGHSRQIQSLKSLRHTMNAQLAAAEHLSGCLLEQMAVLSIESSGKENDVKKKLFESVGLSYNSDSCRSPDGNRTFYTQPHREQFTVSGSIGSITPSVRRNQASPGPQSYEPETARRHRYSLDWSWASFEPPKTTVKRVLLKGDHEKGSANQSRLNTDKQYLTPQAQKKVEVGSKLLSTSAASSNLSGSKGYQGTADIQTKQFNARQSTSLLQKESKKNSALLLESTVTSNSDKGNSRPTDENLRSDVLTRKNELFSAREPILFQQSNKSFHLGPSMPTSLPEPSPTSPSGSIWSLERSKIGSKSTTEHLKFTPSPASAFSSVPNVSERTLVAKTSAEPSQPCLDVTATTSPQSIFGSSSPSRNILSPLPSSQSKTSTPPSSANFTSTSSLSSSGSNHSSISLSSPFLKSESEKSFFNSPVSTYGSKTGGILQAQTSIGNTISATEKDDTIQTSPTQPVLGTSISGLKLVPSASSTLSQSEMDFGGSSNNASIVTSIIKSEKPHSVETLSPVAISSTGTVGSVKNVVTDISEEEMEEAPETDQTTQAALGSLGGLGIGSIPNAGTGKPNPFGAVSQVTSPFTMSAPTGGLFRPATFSFQSPQPSEPVHPAALTFSSGFSSGNPGQISSVTGFGQPAQIGAGQQALGSVLGTFGQSRQLGSGLTGNSSFGGGFMGNAAASASAHGGFASASAHGGFASASTSGGFAGLAAGGGGGFASAAMNAGPFAAAASAGGGGFGAFSSQHGGGLPSGFGGSPGTGRPPSELFTQMRK